MSTPASKIRSEQRTVVTVVALVLGPLFMGGPLAVAVWGAISRSAFSFNSVLGIGMMASLSGVIAYHMLQNYQWVELDGDIVRGRRFWTRQYVERRVDEISVVVPLVAGYEIRFKDGGRRIGLLRGDMTNVQELAEALINRLPAAV
jgi:hypothetical protein